MKDTKKSTLIVMLLLSLMAGYCGNRLVSIMERSGGFSIMAFDTATEKLLSDIVRRPFMVGKSELAIWSGVIAFAVVWLSYLYYLSSRKNYMRGAEHGSARWGTPQDIKPLMDPEPDMNIPLSKTEQISVRGVKSFEADRNKNVVVVGGSGSGKSFSELKPSLMQLHSSYVVTDPKGTILPDVGNMFLRHGYELRSFNTIDFSKSLHYNPLAYIHSEKDILKVVNVLIENTSGEGAQSGEKFWVDCERLIYTALIAYLWTVAPPEDMNIPTMIEMLDLCKVKENNEDYISAMDIMFEELEQEKPSCLAVRQYKKFKQAAGTTMKSILISCSARLAPFDIDDLREITMYDELELDKIGDRKTAFFVIMSDTDSTYSFLVAMIMYQMFNLLCEKADNEYGGALPVQVRCLFDEFANIGKIPDFERLISTIRSRKISCMIILQSLTQLTAKYKDNAETIIDCCDTLVFLGGKSTKTTKQISEMIGKTTIDTQNVNESRGQTGSYSLQNNILGRDLIDASEIGKLKRTQCLVLITGLPPFRSDKYPTSQHKRFKEIHDGGAELFDIRSMRENAESHFMDNVSAVQTIDIDISELNTLA